MIYDYIVVGMGPTGLTLGLNLMKTNKSVLFIEAAESIGGCWKVDYTTKNNTKDVGNNGYFVEHSPKVLSKTGTKSFNKLIKYLGVNPDYKDIYKQSTFLDVSRSIWKEFLIMDIIKLGVYMFLYMLSLNDKNVTIKYWCVSKSISVRAQRYLNILSIAVSNTYDKLTMHAFVQFMYRRYQYMFNLQQLYRPNEWLSVCYERLKQNKNFRFQMNTRMKRFVISKGDNKITELITEHGEVHRAKYVCCVPVRELYTIMRNSFYPNWFVSLNRFRHFVDRSSYTGIGFQMHYTNKFALPEKWCWSCAGDWKIIVVDKTGLLERISHDKEVKMVLSCVIVDLDSRSRHIGKSVNECDTMDQIIKEATRQIRVTMGNNAEYKDPKRITVSDTVYNSKEYGWNSINSSFSYSMGSIPYKGKLDNLFTVGPHNKSEVVIIDTAIEAAQSFTKEVLKIKPVF